ncbi:MAG: hypothetical protein AAF809_04650 [Bacteroidota bacterium]
MALVLGTVLVGAAFAAVYAARTEMRVPEGAHAALGSTLSALAGLPWSGSVERIVTIESDPRDVEADWEDGMDGRRCTGDTSKLFGRTEGLAAPRARSLRVGFRAERDDNGFTGRWEWMLLVHDGPERLRPNPFRVASLGLATQPGERVAVRLRSVNAEGQAATEVTLVVVDDQAGASEVRRTVPFRLGWGIPLGVYVGGDCPASSDLVVIVEKP